jgi:uncharacterized protein (TIGR03437 family)
MTKLILLLAAGLPALSQTTCTYSPAATAFAVPGTATDPANTAKFVVTTQTNCQFVAATTAAWIHIVPPAKGTTYIGTTSVTFTVDANPGTLLRKDQIAFYPGTAVADTPMFVLSVIQVAATCVYSLSPTSANVPVAGGPGSLTVTTGCGWNYSGSSFIELSAPNGTLGNGSLNYKVAPNTCVIPRNGQIAISITGGSPLVFPVTQEGSPANLSISSNSATLGATAVPKQSLTLNTGASCQWASYTDSANWLHATGPTSGTGPATYTYSADNNTGGIRTGHVYFQGGVDANGVPIIAATLTVTQQAVQQPAPQITAIVNSASSAAGPISPGEIVTIYGSNMGPFPAASNTVTYGTQLANVQVMFGSTPAPLIFVSANQINAVVPYAVDGLNSVAVTVQYAGSSATPLTVPVQATTPGLFSRDASGSGPGAILNQDYSYNEKARPAPVGSDVKLYCTGTGITDPVLKDGALAPTTAPFPKIVAQPVTVKVGGIPAQVLYAGPAPTLIAGLTQIDILVPSGVPAASSVPVVVTIGGVSSQANLTLAVQ